MQVRKYDLLFSLQALSDDPNFLLLIKDDDLQSGIHDPLYYMKK